MESMQLLKNIFGHKSEYSQASKNDKEKAYYFINERMSRAYPKQANNLNKLKVDQSKVVDIWRDLVGVKIGTCPGWALTYIKTKKDDKMFDEEVLSSFLERNRMGKRDFYSALSVAEEELYSEYLKYEKAYKDK